MIDAEYSKAYAKSYCGKLWENKKLIAAIARIDVAQAAQQARTVLSLDSMQQTAYDLAIKLNQPSAAVSAGTAIARLYGLDQPDGRIDKPLQIIVNTEPKPAIEPKPDIKPIQGVG